MVETLLVVLIAFQSIALVAVAVAVVLYARKTSDSVREFGQAASDLRDCLVPVAQDLKKTINDTDGLVLAARTEVDRIGRLSASIERIMEVVALVQTAEKAVASSKTTAVSVIQGIKAGLQALRSVRRNSEEGSEHVE
jgi:hypothetical protein